MPTLSLLLLDIIACNSGKVPEVGKQEVTLASFNHFDLFYSVSGRVPALPRAGRAGLLERERVH